jgi:hypothetical protein
VNLITTHHICCDHTVFSLIKLLKDDLSIWEIFESMYTQKIKNNWIMTQNWQQTLKHHFNKYLSYV